METEFPSRFKRLFAGPMWNGQGNNVTRKQCDKGSKKCKILINPLSTNAP